MFTSGWKRSRGSRMTCSAVPEVFADWLDVTQSPDPEENTVLDVRSLLLDAGADFTHEGAYRLDGGVARVEERSRYSRLSFSGSVLAALRCRGLYLELLSRLGAAPHKVTRLDAAIDVPTDAPFVLRELWERYPMDVNLGRKALPTKRITSTRPDGLETGTWYAGYRTAARATARVYDKAWERFEKVGEVLEPCTRYEITVRKDFGASLADAADPTRIFYHVASPALLPRPDGVPPWSPDWGEGWSYDPPDRLPADVLKRRVEFSPELDDLVALSDTLGRYGRNMLLVLLAKRLGLSDRLKPSL